MLFCVTKTFLLFPLLWLVRYFFLCFSFLFHLSFDLASIRSIFFIHLRNTEWNSTKPGWPSNWWHCKYTNIESIESSTRAKWLFRFFVRLVEIQSFTSLMSLFFFSLPSKIAKLGGKRRKMPGRNGTRYNIALWDMPRCLFFPLGLEMRIVTIDNSKRRSRARRMYECSSKLTKPMKIHDRRPERFALLSSNSCPRFFAIWNLLIAVTRFFPHTRSSSATTICTRTTVPITVPIDEAILSWDRPSFTSTFFSVTQQLSLKPFIRNRLYFMYT